MCYTLFWLSTKAIFPWAWRHQPNQLRKNSIVVHEWVSQAMLHIQKPIVWPFGTMCTSPDVHLPTLATCCFGWSGHVHPHQFAGFHPFCSMNCKGKLQVTELDLLVQMTLLLNGDSMSCIKEQKRSLCGKSNTLLKITTDVLLAPVKWFFLSTVIICQGGEGQTWQGRKAQEKRRGKQAKGKAPRLWKRQSVGPSKIKRSARKPYSRHQCTTALASPSFASHLLPPPNSESFSFFPRGAAFFCEKRSSRLAVLVQAGRS